MELDILHPAILFCPCVVFMYCQRALNNKEFLVMSVPSNWQDVPTET